MNGRVNGLILFLVALAIGTALGLLYTWGISPVKFYNTAPSQLRADLKEEYVLLICNTYSADRDWAAAEQRLATLNEPNIADALSRLTGRAIAEGKPIAEIRSLATVADRLGVSNPAFAPFISYTAPATPTPVAERATFTPTPLPSPTDTPTPEPTSPATATPTPSPSPTRQLSYRLLTQQRICDADRPEPMLQIIVRAADGSDVAGEEVLISWGDLTFSIFTGFKPELGRGYADAIMQPGVSYSVQLAAGSEQVSGIQTAPCNSRAGERLYSTRLVFEKTSP